MRMGGAHRLLSRPGRPKVTLSQASASSTYYYYWHDDARAPDFARLVEIHRKPPLSICP